MGPSLAIIVMTIRVIMTIAMFAARAVLSLVMLAIQAAGGGKPRIRIVPRVRL